MGSLIEHKRVNVNPSGDELEGIQAMMRGNDAPLFWAKKMKDGLGMEVKNVYNRCMSLLYYRPDALKTQDKYETLRGRLDELEEETIKHLKDVKHLKEDYSKVWKKNFSKYPHPDKGYSVEYDDKDPFDDTWMQHEILRTSMEIQEAAAIYMQAVEKILAQLRDEVQPEIEKLLEGYIEQESATITLDEWAKLSERELTGELERIQGEVDKILMKHWAGVASAMLGTAYAGTTPSYIGSTFTGKKSVTKAYIQFNPKDYDVDGQMVNTTFYTYLAQWAETAPKTPASKNRYFVRLTAQPIIDKLADALVDTSEYEDEEITHMTKLKDTLEALLVYVDAVEKDLVTNMDGVQPDPNDEFDLAMVREELK